MASCTRAGLAGTRSGLFLEQIRVTKEMRNADVQRGRAGKSVRPRFFCWENVPGVFSSGYPKGADFQLVLQQIIGINCGAVFIPRPHPWPSTSPLGLATCWANFTGICVLPGVAGL